MELQHTITYPADVEAVYGMLIDEEFRARVCRATGALDHSVRVAPGPTGTTVTTTRIMPPEVPDAVRRFVGDRIEVRQQEHWSDADGAGRRAAEVSLDIAGTPASMHGHIVLEPTGDGCRETVRGDVRVRVPFVGGMVEPEIAKAIRAALDKEAEVGRAWLDGGGPGDGVDTATGG